MARQRSFEVAAINLSMHPHSLTKYVELFRTLGRMRVGVSIRGDYQALIGTVREIEAGKPENGLTGEIYKYFELDPNSPWFNVVRQKVAEDDERAKIRIPAELKPHFSLYYYVFYPRGHRFFFETTDGQNKLTPGAGAKMLGRLFQKPSVAQEFGSIDITVEPRSETLEKIFAIPNLRRLRIEVTRPNADDLGSARKKFMDRLNNMNAKREITELAAQQGKSLKPDAQARTQAAVAQSNGYVEAEGYNADGKRVYESTEIHPLQETVKYDPGVVGHRDALIQKSEEMLKFVLKRDQEKAAKDE